MAKVFTRNVFAVPRIDCDKCTKNGCGGLKRFIRYLYEYKQGQRIRNVGFVKVEQNEETTVVHIHGKGLQLEGNKTLKLYIFYRANKECVGIRQGDVENVNPAVNYRLAYTADDTGDKSNYPLIDGIIMEHGNERKFAAVWNDMPVDVEHMRVWERAVTGSVMEESAEEKMTSGEEDAVEDEFDEERKEVESPRQNSGSSRYTKIQRRDISRLARREWKLANNSFLLHGYHNYQHLLLIEEGDECWLGVPGVYHEREAKAAEAFGFPRFVRVGDEDVSLDNEEKNEMDDFGYWCRQVRK